MPRKQNITAQGHPEAEPAQCKLWVNEQSTHFPKAQLPSQHPHTARETPPCLAMGTLGQEEPRALPRPRLLGLNGGCPSLPLCPTLRICLWRGGRCSAAGAAGGQGPFHGSLQHGAEQPAQHGTRGAQPWRPPLTGQRCPPTPRYRPALAQGAPRGPDSELSLTHSISLAPHQGPCGHWPALAPRGAIGDRAHGLPVGRASWGRAPPEHREPDPSNGNSPPSATGSPPAGRQTDRGMDGGTEGWTAGPSPELSNSRCVPVAPGWQTGCGKGQTRPGRVWQLRCRAWHIPAPR